MKPKMRRRPLLCLSSVIFQWARCLRCRLPKPWRTFGPPKNPPIFPQMTVIWRGLFSTGRTKLLPPHPQRLRYPINPIEPTRDYPSRSNFDRSTDADHFPDFVHLFVRDRDASVRPVVQSVCLPHPRVLLRKSMQHDVSAGADA